jgi:pyridoxal phosphate enzyme (YggS family)
MPSPRTREQVHAAVSELRSRIALACERVGRDPSSVRLVAAGKSVPAQTLGWAFESGVTDLGENYVQELATKREMLPGATWHFIGTLQSRTAARVAELADVVQTLAPGRASDRLAHAAAGRDVALDALIEVDFAGRGSGVEPDRCERFADEVAGLEGVRLVGLMTLPPPTATADEARPYFVRLRELRDRVAEAHPAAVELSMGMSLDYEVAAEEGATIVRVGTALFGARPPA